MNEKDIKSYMDEFNVSRDAAIEGIADYYDIEYQKMKETYNDVISSTH